MLLACPQPVGMSDPTYSLRILLDSGNGFVDRLLGSYALR
jgi:hypothetical protein